VRPEDATGCLDWTDPIPASCDVAIVGGGFSGLMTAIGILRREPRAKVVVLERSPQWAPGIAYGACEPMQLLNVRADRMGAEEADPTEFARWLATRHPGYGAKDFVPRSLFGTYLNETVARGLAPHRERVALSQAGVERLTEIGDGGFRVVVSPRGEAGVKSEMRARAVILALGLPSARPVWPGDALDALRDPWADDAYEGLDVNDPVLIVGTGLTALDVLVALAARDHRGLLTFVSRNGRFPLPHSDPQPGVPPLVLAVDDLRTPRLALRALRRLAQRCRDLGRPWQEALDAVRPHTTATWQQWDDRERERFLRHLRPYWEVHRHRAPLGVLRVLNDRIASGQARILRGTIGRLSRPLANGSPHARASVMVAEPDGSTRRVDAARVFHCIGPAMRVDQSSDPLLRSLLASGAVSTDAASLGLRTDGEGRVRRADGSFDRSLFVLGALRRGELWESTAVPELRLQVDSVAHEVASSLAPALSLR
jgi:uncharacterized NAD(P)/FAD-binding protein YdhS